jgi:integrase
MGTPEKRPGLRKRGRAFYFDTQAKPRRWIPLGTDEAKALREYERLRAAPIAAGTIDAMLRDHLDAIAVAPGTLELYRIFRKHLSGVFGHLAPGELTQADIRKYLTDCPRTSFRGEIALLSSAYWRAMDKGAVTFNPCAGVKVKRAKAKRTRLLSPEEIDAIIEKAEPVLAVAIELAYATGLRVSDLCALRWGDLERQVRTRKTGVRQRYDLDETLAPILARARALQARVGSLHVLCGRGGKPLDKDAIGYLWTKACEAAKVDDARFHDIRAAAATALDAEGGNAQAFLGHFDAKTTRLYLRGRQISTVKPLRRMGKT